MKITEVSYSMKYSAQQSSGRWGGEEVTLVATVAPDENPEHALAKLKLLCEHQLHGEEWAASYKTALNVVNAGVAEEHILASAKRTVANYEAWANAVGDVRKEVMA
jgi:hypothetical protein